MAEIAPTQVPATALTCVCKLKWTKKQNTDQMTIRNLEALRIMTAGILSGKDEQALAEAKGILDAELQQYMAGIQLTLPIQPGAAMGMNDIGSRRL